MQNRLQPASHSITCSELCSDQISLHSIRFAFQHQVLPNLIYIYYLMDWAVQRRVSNILKLKHTSVKVRWEWCNVPRFSWDGWLWGVCELEEWWEFQQQFLKLEVAFCSFLFGTLPGLIDTTLSLANGHFTSIPPRELIRSRCVILHGRMFLALQSKNEMKH